MKTKAILRKRTQGIRLERSTGTLWEKVGLVGSRRNKVEFTTWRLDRFVHTLDSRIDSVDFSNGGLQENLMDGIERHIDADFRWFGLRVS